MGLPATVVIRVMIRDIHIVEEQNVLKLLGTILGYHKTVAEGSNSYSYFRSVLQVRVFSKNA